jgi:hypothetical protein
MVFNLVRRADALLDVGLLHRSRAQHDRKNHPEIFCPSLFRKLRGNAVKVFEHFHPALGTKSVGFNNGALDFRCDLLSVANQLCQFLISLGDPCAHQSTLHLISVMHPLDGSRLLIIQGKLREKPARGRALRFPEVDGNSHQETNGDRCRENDQTSSHFRTTCAYGSTSWR